MITFWIAAALLSALAALPILAGAARASQRDAAAENPTLLLHRRQLSEIDDLAARGLLSESERASARAEAGRRLLAAAEEAEAAPASNARTRSLIVAGAVAAPLIALGIYFAVGSPTDRDQPFAQRLKGWEAKMQADPSQLQLDEMGALLEEIGRRKPNDPEAPRNLAIVRMQQGDAGGAIVALSRATVLAPQRADLWAELGLARVAQAEGVIDDEARGDFERALALEPDRPLPRYYLARRKISDGKVAEGLAEWRTLRATLAPGEAATTFNREIAAVEATGKLPVAGAETAQAQPEVGAAQIAAMVEGLAERLKTQPDDPEGWARLVRAYGVMGETAKRDAALAEARARYKDRPEVLDALAAAAQVPR